MVKPSILIVGTPRSGTTNLLKGLSSHYNTLAAFEPWNHKNGEHLHDENISTVTGKYRLVKCLVNQRPVIHKGTHIGEFYKDIIPNYKNVILLGRKNVHDLAISLGYQYQKTGIEKFPSHNWHTTYSVDEEKIKPLYTMATERLLELVTLSEFTGIPITWYEDLYSSDVETVTKTFNSLNLDIDIKSFIKYLNPNNRYRKFDKLATKI